jgi:hypothetical protein
LINISKRIISQSKNLYEISILKDGQTLLEIYSQDASVKMNVPVGFIESSILIDVPYVFSRQDMISKGYDIGIRKMGHNFEIFYPNYLESFEIDLIYCVE